METGIIVLNHNQEKLKSGIKSYAETEKNWKPVYKIVTKTKMH